MNQPNIDAEMGLDAYGSSTPDEWISGVLSRLQSSSKWKVSQVEIGIEDDADSERVSVVRELEIESELRAMLSESSQCSCFLTLDDTTGGWSLPLMFTREGGHTTLTASIYDEDLRSHGSTWNRIRLLLELSTDLLLDEATQWLRFGIEGEDIASPDSSLFVVLSEVLWCKMTEESRVALSPVTEEASGLRVIWCSPPPGRNVPEDFEAHFSSVSSAIMSS